MMRRFAVRSSSLSKSRGWSFASIQGRWRSWPTKTCRSPAAWVALLADEDLPESGCLVIDYRMPGMDGLQLVEALKAREVALPVILITGRANKQLRRFAASLGISYVLEKPLSDGALIESIRLALGTCD
jgi:FixJ family two-component response regulator